MALRRLCKSGGSGEAGQCPAIYVADDPAQMVAQGVILDDHTSAELQDPGADETGVALPTETVLRAAALFLAEQGRPAMLAEVQEYLAGTQGQQ